MAKRRVEPLYLDCDRLQAVTVWLGAWANFALIAWCLYWLAAHIGGIGLAWPWFVAAFFAGLFLADLLSGFVHWASDTWFDEIMIERIVSISREHHIYPHHIAGYGLRDLVGYSSTPTVFVVGPVALALTLGGPPSDAAYLATFLCAVVALCMVFGSHTHLLGHVRTESRIIRFLQRAGFLITPSYHTVHHSCGHDIRYCVVNGWANIVCDRIGFWRRLERLVHALTGAVPRSNDHEWFARFREDPSFMRNPIPSLVALRRRDAAVRATEGA